MMKHHTDYLTFTTRARQEIIDITDDVERCRAAAGIREGMVLVSAMHISASVFVNDHEPNLWGDIIRWLEDASRPGTRIITATTPAPARTTPPRTFAPSPSVTR
jgi:Uncharacterized conserved protein